MSIRRPKRLRRKLRSATYETLTSRAAVLITASKFTAHRSISAPLIFSLRSLSLLVSEPSESTIRRHEQQMPGVRYRVANFLPRSDFKHGLSVGSVRPARLIRQAMNIGAMNRISRCVIEYLGSQGQKACGCERTAPGSGQVVLRSSASSYSRSGRATQPAAASSEFGRVDKTHEYDRSRAPG